MGPLTWGQWRRLFRGEPAAKVCAGLSRTALDIVYYAVLRRLPAKPAAAAMLVAIEARLTGFDRIDFAVNAVNEWKAAMEEKPAEKELPNLLDSFP